MLCLTILFDSTLLVLPNPRLETPRSRSRRWWGQPHRPASVEVRRNRESVVRKHLENRPVPERAEAEGFPPGRRGLEEGVCAVYGRGVYMMRSLLGGMFVRLGAPDQEELGRREEDYFGGACGVERIILVFCPRRKEGT
jgi:hypothetical protein